MAFCQAHQFSLAKLLTVSQPTTVTCTQSDHATRAGSYMQALYFAPNGATKDNVTDPFPLLPVVTGYPQTSAIAVLPLEAPHYATQVCCYMLTKSMHGR